MDESNLIMRILVVFKNTFTSVYNWMITLFNETGATGYIIGVIIAMLVVRFAVYPFFKGGIVNAGSSDSVVKSNPIRVSGGSDRVGLQPYNGKRLRIERK